MPACNRARRIGTPVRLLTAANFNQLGTIVEVKRRVSDITPWMFVIKTPDGELHKLLRYEFATSALAEGSPRCVPVASVPEQKPKPTHARPRRRGNFADIARIKEASK